MEKGANRAHPDTPQRLCNIAYFIISATVQAVWMPLLLFSPLRQRVSDKELWVTTLLSLLMLAAAFG